MVRYARSIRRFGGRAKSYGRYTKARVGTSVAAIISGLLLLWVTSKFIDMIANYQVNASDTTQCLTGCQGINVTNFGAYSTWLQPILPIVALLVVIIPIVWLVRGKLF